MKYKLRSRNRGRELKEDFINRSKKAFSLTKPERNYIVKKLNKTNKSIKRKLTKDLDKNINFWNLYN